MLCLLRLCRIGKWGECERGSIEGKDRCGPFLFSDIVCVNLEAIFLQWLCLFANCMHEGRKEPFVFLFF